MRLALGAGRWRLVRQLLIESVMLSTIGAIAGLVLARSGSRAIVAMLSTRTQVVEVDLAMDWRVFAFTTVVGVLTGLLFGVAPAFRGTRLTPADALRDHSRGIVSGGGRFQVGHALVALRVALSFVLVFGSTLFVRTLVALTTQEMGSESSHVLVGNLIGKTFTIVGSSKQRPDRVMEIVGLAANAKYQRLREAAQPIMYGAFAQERTIFSSQRIAVRTIGAPMDSRNAVVAAITGVHKDIAIDLKRLDDDLGANVLQERLVANLSGVFGGLALLLAALGLYGVMSYTVTRRRNEIGIRMALGAEPRKVVGLVLRNVAVITVAGLIAGAAAAAGTGRFINTLLYNLAATDRTMIVVTTIILASAAAIAGYLPARRAARIDPMAALREE